MKIFYVDPEMYVDYFGNIISYPLEDLHDEDILFQMTAVEFANKVNRILPVPLPSNGVQVAGS